jgi:hypothetical protein
MGQMQITASDRELMEADYQDYMERLCEENLLELWQAAQQRDQAINEEVLALVSEGQSEIPF